MNRKDYGCRYMYVYVKKERKTGKERIKLYLCITSIHLYVFLKYIQVSIHYIYFLFFILSIIYLLFIHLSIIYPSIYRFTRPMKIK